MTGFGVPTPYDEQRAAEAVGAAQQARYELSRDGPAPSVAAILREMGRHADGRPRDGADVDDVTASEAARRALDRSTCDYCGHERRNHPVVDGKGGLACSGPESWGGE